MVIKMQTKSKSESRNYRCISLFVCLLHEKVPVTVKVPEDSRVLRVRCLCCRPPIASTPGLSPPERPGLDNMTSQTWSEGRVCPSIEFEFMSTIFLNHGTGFLGPNQTNNSFGTQSKLKLANSSFRFAD